MTSEIGRLLRSPGEPDSIWTEYTFADDARNIVTAGDARSVGSCQLQAVDIGDSLVVVLSGYGEYGETPALFTYYRVAPDGPVIDLNGDDTAFATPRDFQDAWALTEDQRPDSAACNPAASATGWCSRPVEIYE